MSCNGFQPKEKNRRGVKSRKISSHGEHFNRSAEKKLAINAVYGKLMIYMREMWDRET